MTPFKRDVFKLFSQIMRSEMINKSGQHDTCFFFLFPLLMKRETIDRVRLKVAWKRQEAWEDVLQDICGFIASWRTVTCVTDRPRNPTDLLTNSLSHLLHWQWTEIWIQPLWSVLQLFASSFTFRERRNSQMSLVLYWLIFVYSFDPKCDIFKCVIFYKILQIIQIFNVPSTDKFMLHGSFFVQNIGEL